MPIRNRFKQLAAARGDNTNYKFWKRSGLSQSTAYRIYQDASAYPSESVLSTVCRSYNVQPGDCLEYIPDEVMPEQ